MIARLPRERAPVLPYLGIEIEHDAPGDLPFERCEIIDAALRAIVRAGRAVDVDAAVAVLIDDAVGFAGEADARHSASTPSRCNQSSQRNRPLGKPQQD